MNSDQRKQRQEELQRAYRHVFGGSQGELVLADLRSEAGWDEPFSIKCSDMEAGIKMGQHNLMLHIFDMLKES